MNRHKQQSEKARELIEKLRNENGKSIDIDEVRIIVHHIIDNADYGKIYIL